jgi:hypothetical protein
VFLNHEYEFMQSKTLRVVSRFLNTNKQIGSLLKTKYIVVLDYSGCLPVVVVCVDLLLFFYSSSDDFFTSSSPQKNLK